MQSYLDHLVIVAPTLEVGSAFIKTCLGVDVENGGAHVAMGTHNRLLRLGEALYLEVITVDPAAAAPGRPRWFALDHVNPATAAKLAGWVARTDDIEHASQLFAHIVGNVERMARGTLSWNITIPQDGSMPLGGAAPSLIQWQQTTHPANTLQDQGCSLVALDVFCSEPEVVATLLATMNFAGPVRFHQQSAAEPPRLTAQIQTPHGLRSL